MKGYLYAALFSSAIAAAAPAAALSVEQKPLPAPAWKVDEHALKTSEQAAQPEPSAGNHTDSLLQRQTRRLQMLQDLAERERARAEKLRRMQKKES